MSTLAELVDGVIGVDTHRDTLAAAALTPVGGLLAQKAPNGAEGRRGQGVTVAIDADDAIDELSQGGHGGGLPSGDGRGRCRPGRKHRAAEL